MASFMSRVIKCLLTNRSRWIITAVLVIAILVVYQCVGYRNDPHGTGQSQTKPHLVFGILSADGNRDLRDAQRNTWISPALRLKGYDVNQFQQRYTFKTASSSGENGRETVRDNITNQSVKGNFDELDMAKRKSFVGKRCSEIKQWPRYSRNDDSRAYMFVDQKFGLVACNNHKVGSSSLIRFLYQLRNDSKLNEAYFRGVMLSRNLRPRALNRLPYTFFMFVRDPLERLLSAYNDNRGVMVRGKKPSFETFLNTRIVNSSSLNTHHEPFYSRCKPCSIKYEYFGTLDTYFNDLKYILKSVQIPLDNVPHLRRVSKQGNTTLDRRLIDLPWTVKNAVWKRYRADYHIFGYPHPADKFR